eukprot:TRINITY_DN35147_c0_g2_i1.p1 TRINITY_DN35147_c0_g2~~TRINITY_DN35147_c0_g2_i1.p1  ORF type:complete len:479 (+),score=117.05 TRINITY_DN35147_c0_g2_i1:392-1828(+)
MKVEHHEDFKTLHGDMQSQHSRMKAIHEMVRGCRESMEKAAGKAQDEQIAAKGRVEQIQQEADVLKNQLAARQAALDRKLQEVMEAEREVARLKKVPLLPNDNSLNGKTLFGRLDSDGNGLIDPREFEEGIKNMIAEAQRLKALVATAGWNSANGGRRMAEVAFQMADSNGDGCLRWNQGEVQNFVRSVFSRSAATLPRWDDNKWYDLFRVADFDASHTLSMGEAIEFARLCLEASLAEMKQLKEVARALDEQSAPSSAELFARGYAYTLSLPAEFQELPMLLQGCIQQNAVQQGRMSRLIETGEHVRAAVNIQLYHDKDRNGVLTWNSGEIREFIQGLFRYFGLVPPAEQQMYQIFLRCDQDRSNSLDARECIVMADAIFRTMFAPGITYVTRGSVVSTVSSAAYRVSSSPTAAAGAAPAGTTLVRSVSGSPMGGRSPYASYSSSGFPVAGPAVPTGSVYVRMAGTASPRARSPFGM